MNEDQLEQNIIEIIQNQRYTYIYGPNIDPGTPNSERDTFDQVILVKRLKENINKLNPTLSEYVKEAAIKKVLDIHTIDQTSNNQTFHTYLTEGIKIDNLQNGEMVGVTVRIVDFDNPLNNEFLVLNQYTVTYNNKKKRPDIILFVNGLPLVSIELKNPTDEKATLLSAYNQFQTYKKYIPQLYDYNAILVVSDGIDARYGSLTAPWSRFMTWKTKDGLKEDPNTEPQINTLVEGMLNPKRLLEIIKDFTVFEKEEKIDEENGLSQVETTKKIAGYHQYYAVKKAVDSTIQAAQDNGNGKAGVMWHTQGSGKSLSMVFFAGKIVEKLNNPTIVVITDRNDLDDQLFQTFVASSQLLKQKPQQASSRRDLRRLLNTTSGRIIFTTIQKFFPFDNEDTHPLLSDRRNIVVIADEAHRSQYGFGARTIYVKDEQGNEVATKTAYGNAKYLREALPNASFIGFTGTPIDFADRSTPRVFGDYIDIYDIAQAVDDGATVKIFYESRLAQVHIKEEYEDKLDDMIEEYTEKEELTLSEEEKIKWTRLESIVGQKERMNDVAKDIVQHFSSRKEVYNGKAMVVCMSRRIAIEMYNEIVKLKPEWHSENIKDGKIKIIMTSSSTDPLSWQPFNTTKEEKKVLAQRFKDPEDKLDMVVVVDMWLTGFDAPSVTTMYLDKPMKGHTLMQAIARVNRVYEDKNGGLIVDYIGIGTELKKALQIYSQSGGRGEPTLDISEAVHVMREKYEIVQNLLWGFDYRRYFNVGINEKLTILLETQEFILAKGEKAKDEFIKYVTDLTKAFALVVPRPEAMEIKEEVGFFQAVKARLLKYIDGEPRPTEKDIGTAIRQIIDKAVISEGVIDIYKEAGIEKPNISILSSEFLEEVKNMKYKNLSLELLKKLLNDEIKNRGRINVVQNKKFSERLQEVIRKYRANLLTTVQVINELIEIAKDMKKDDEHLESLGLTTEEIAFYDALASNDSAKKVLGDEVLKEIAQDLLVQIKKNATIDLTIRESVKAKLRILVKRTLKRYNYPPDKQKQATEMVLKQAEVLTEDSI